MAEFTLAVRERRVLSSIGSLTSRRTVYCPARRGSFDTAACNGCPEAQRVTDQTVQCASRAAAAPPGIAAAAATAATSTTTLVRADARATDLIDRLGPMPGPVPVVDCADRFLGFLSLPDPGRPRWPWTAAPPQLACDLAVHPWRCILETQPLGEALRVMAHRGARSIALVNATGAVQGVLLDIDALRELARRPAP